MRAQHGSHHGWGGAVGPPSGISERAGRVAAYTNEAAATPVDSAILTATPTAACTQKGDVWGQG